MLMIHGGGFGQSVADPRLACPTVFDRGLVRDVRDLTLATQAVFSALAAQYRPPTDAAYIALRRRAEAVQALTERQASLDVPALAALGGGVQQELCALVQTALDAADRHGNIATVRAAVTLMHNQIDAFFRRVEHIPTQPPAPTRGPVPLGTGLVILGVLFGLSAGGYYAWTRLRKPSS